MNRSIHTCSDTRGEDYTRETTGSGMTYYTMPGLRAHGITVLCTSRLGSKNGRDFEVNMADHESLRAFLQSLGFDSGNLVTVNQVHGTSLIVVDNNGSVRGDRNAADGIISLDSSKILGIVTADCLSVALSAQSHNVMCLLHAGWRGLAGGIISKALDTLTGTCGIDPGNLAAGLGPAIGSCCYPVGNDVAAVFKRQFPFADRVMSKDTDGNTRLDLRKTAVKVLVKAGVPEDHIFSVDLCTSCNNDLFYSYRKEKENCGRLMSFMAWNNDLTQSPNAL